MKTIYLFIGLFTCKCSFSQDIRQKLDRAINSLAADEQFSHSILSIYVVDGKTGKVVYDKNGQVGMVPASCQKVIISVSAFEILGKYFIYRTSFGYGKTIEADTSKINLYLIGSGDPTLGSWRWEQTSEDYITKKMIREVNKLKVRTIEELIIDDSQWGTQTIPAGWPWEDVGQYYGAGCNSLTWAENQYNIVLKPGKKVGDSVAVLNPGILPYWRIRNELKTGPMGSGDRVYVFRSFYHNDIFLRGTAPLGVDSLIVAAAAPDGKSLVHKKVWPLLNEKAITTMKLNFQLSEFPEMYDRRNKMEKVICDFISPTFDSMNFWFLRKSINLYGEAFVKTIAYEETRVGSTDTGVNIIKDFWASKGIERSSLKIIDGSGLSPANRVTTAALVTVLQYAKQRPWFPSFYYALPEINGIKMKDGYIGGVRAYTGYVKSAAGAEYSFSFIVNNFDGNPATAREKMWSVLDLLK